MLWYQHSLHSCYRDRIGQYCTRLNALAVGLFLHGMIHISEQQVIHTLLDEASPVLYYCTGRGHFIPSAQHECTAVDALPRDIQSALCNPHLRWCSLASANAQASIYLHKYGMYCMYYMYYMYYTSRMGCQRNSEMGTTDCYSCHSHISHSFSLHYCTLTCHPLYYHRNATPRWLSFFGKRHFLFQRSSWLAMHDGHRSYSVEAHSLATKILTDAGT